tara:strand:+ start:25444 stop:25692 length:249 start_codon:yes stop_codon:yes gene_type:complete
MPGMNKNPLNMAIQKVKGRKMGGSMMPTAEELNPGKSVDVTEMAMGGYMDGEIEKKMMGGYMGGGYMGKMAMGGYMDKKGKK